MSDDKPQPAWLTDSQAAAFREMAPYLDRLQTIARQRGWPLGQLLVKSVVEELEPLMPDVPRPSGPEPIKRFRPRDRALTDEEAALRLDIDAKAAELETLLNRVKSGRYRSLAFTALEEAVMWADREMRS